MSQAPVVIVTIEFERYAQVDNTLRLLAARTGENIADTIVGELVEAEPERLQQTPYPPELPGLPGQRYERTYTLANSWSQDRLGPGRWVIINDARQKGREYAEYVVGEPEDQADIHRGRWWTGRKKVEEHFARYGPGAIEETLARRYDQAMTQGFG